MPFYTMPFEDVATGSTIDLYKTMGAIIVPDTVGNRCRVRGLHAFPSNDTSQDFDIAVRLSRIASRTAGTAGSSSPVTGANMPKHDPGSVASIVTGARNYTSEPTTYETEDLWVGGFNMRGGVINERFDDDEMYRVTQDMLCGVRCAPRAAVALRVSGVIIFEVY